MLLRSYGRRFLPAVGIPLVLFALLLGCLDWAASSASAPQTSPQAAPAASAPAAGGAPAAKPAQASAPPVSAPPEPAKSSPEEAVRRAWENARSLGSYSFATDLVQTTYPALALSSAGSGPKQSTIYVEGELNIPARKLRMSIHQSGGNLLNARDGAEGRVEGDHAYIREPGGAWQETDDFSTSFAPASDLLAYLAGMKNVREVPREVGPTESVPAPDISRYAFDFDGPAFATYIRDRLERQLQESGQLPPNISIDATDQFKAIEGKGELWTGERGLPLRMTVHLVYPRERNGSRSEVDIKTDFSGFPAPAATLGGQDPLSWMSLGHSLPQLPAAAQESGRTAASLAFGIGALAVLIACRRSRKAYAAIVVAMILSMVLVPLMQNERAAAFFERQNERQSSLEESQQQQRAAQAALDKANPAWNPNQDPLAGPTSARQVTGNRDQPPAVGVETVGTPAGALLSGSTPPSPDDPNCLLSDEGDCDPPSGDGLTNEQEDQIGTNPILLDTDGDGLTDGQEVLKLGTDPMVVDTDGDSISDAVEAAGFEYGGRHWYLDAMNADTNDDGLVDSIECTPLIQGIPSAAVIAAECDTDGDGIPSVFDPDNDNDGVPDRLDLSPDKLIDQGGPRANATGVQPFSRNSPFKLKVQDLNPGWPAFLDIQLRPENAQHLAYAMNVLDWPAGDWEGQIQHVGSTTWADSNNPDIARTEDPSNSLGDMRLVPLLEIQMSGSSIPLKQTTPEVTATVRSGASKVADVKLTQQAGITATYDIKLEFKNMAAGSYTVQLRKGSCKSLEPAIQSYSGVQNGQTKLYAAHVVADLADGDHALLFNTGSPSYACGDIPPVVRVPGHPEKIVDTSVLAPYGISVKQIDDNTLKAFVPLNLLSDDTGGGKTAFSARMLYWPDASAMWSTAQAMRFVWAVEAITDECNENGFNLTEEDREKDPENYDKQYKDHCTKNRLPDETQIVQTYDESFHITGLAVREDHGMDVAIAYPNPTKDDYTDDSLWELSWGLGQSFVTQRDCEDASTIHTDPNPNTCHSDNLRDLGVSLQDADDVTVANQTIGNVFDYRRPVPDLVTETERWGIPADALEVETHQYATQDHLSEMAMVVTPAILDKFYQQYYVNLHKSVTPTLLFAREEHFRSAGIEATTDTSDGIVTLSVGSAYEEKTLTGMSWAPFKYDSTAGWQAYPIEEYWDPLGEDLKTKFFAQYPNETPESNEGRVTVAQSYYLGMYNGVENEIAGLGCETAAECPYPEEEGESYENIIQASEKFTSRLSHVATEIAAEIYGTYKKEVLTHDYDVISCPSPNQPACTGFFESVWDGLKEFFYSPWKELLSHGVGGKVSVGILAGVVVSAVALTIITLAHADNAANAVAAVARGLTTVVATFATARALASAVKMFGGGGIGAALKAGFTRQAFDIKSHKAGAVALVIHVIVTWAAWVLSFTLNHIKAGSMAWDNSLANTIAASITAFVMFMVLSVIPLGELVGAIIGLIDALCAQICNAFLSEEQREGAWADWLCGGITGIATNLFKRVVYSGKLLPLMEPDEDLGEPYYPRLQLAGFGIDLVDNAKGIVEGNAIKPYISFTNTIDLAKAPVAMQELIWFWQFSEENLKTSTFKYKWQQEEESFDDEFSREGMENPDWTYYEGDLPLQYIQHAFAGAGPIPLPSAGLNKEVNLYFSEAYALPEQECWGLGGAKYCYIATEKQTLNYPVGEGIVFDVLPATLDGFYTLASRGNGYYALAWDDEFPNLADADGDGLPATADVNDSKWDTDDDGLSDYFEHETGSSPASKDTDGDGLSDMQEVLLGTDSASKDTDGDGLYDCQEVFHYVETADTMGPNNMPVCGQTGAWSGGWTIVYGNNSGVPVSTLVTSNPLDVDTDGDGLTDMQEYTYGYNPHVRSNLNVLSVDTTLSGAGEGLDRFVKAGDSLSYSAEIKNELDNRQAQGLFSTKTSEGLSTQNLNPQPFNLAPQQSETVSGNVLVSANAATGVYSLTQVAGALITNLSVLSDDASLWLRFDDAVGSTTYADSSGRVPANDGACAGTCSVDPASGRVGGALNLTGGGYVQSAAQVSDAAFSVSLWFKVGQSSSLSGVLFASQNTFRTKVYLSSGKVCAIPLSSGSIPPPACASRDIGDNSWHHLVVADSGRTGGGRVVLYLDGVAAAATLGPTLSSGGATGVLIGGKAGTNFVGSIDDVRLFERVLTASEAAALANQPLFHMDFNSTPWSDLSPYHTTIASCKPTLLSPFSVCPSSETSGVTGGAAKFDGTQYLSIPASSQLKLSSGRFSLSAWIRPSNRGGNDARDTYPQGILGLDSGATGAYPSLQRVGSKLRFGMSDGGGWHVLFTSGDVLTPDQWNHVALTLVPVASGYELRLYVNGTLVSGTPTTVSLASPSETTSFDIGRTSSTATLKADSYLQGMNGDGDQCYSWNSSEMCMAIDAQQVWSQGGLDCGEQGSLAVNQSFSGSTSMVLWEDDNDPRCGSAPNKAATKAGNDDDTCYFSSPVTGTPIVFSTEQPGFSRSKYSFYSCGDGYFYVTLNNNSIPFYGSIDEVQIFGQALDQDGINELFVNPAAAMHVELDEAPGATAFVDRSATHAAASCTDSATCATSGTPGRLNQAAWFDGSNDYIKIGNFGDFQATSAAAWIYLDKTSSDRKSVLSYKESDNCGFVLAVEGTKPKFWVKTPLEWQSAVGATDVPLSQWVHLAGTYDGTNIIIYMNGVEQARTATSGAMSQCTGYTSIGSRNSFDRHYFPGAIDDAWVFSVALPPERIAGLYHAAPLMHLRLDEAHGATQFADNANAGRKGSCSAGGCPMTGENVRGQVGLAAEFDGVDDRVSLSDGTGTEVFTVGAWVMPTVANPAPVAGLVHELVGKWTTGAINYRLYMGDDLKPGLEWGCSPTDLKVNGTTPLILNHWNHVMGTFDGNVLTLYVNGVPTPSTSVGSAAKCTTASSVEIGGKSGLSASQYFTGRLDEVVTYNHALTPRQVRELYLYQNGWVEDRESHNITVDNDPPTARILINETSPYWPNQATVVAISAEDTGSGIDGVTLSAQKGSGETQTWAASPCAGQGGETNWCATFVPSVPSGEGVYTLTATATDRVGISGVSPQKEVRVDDTKPLLGITATSLQRFNAHGNNKKPGHSLVTVSGTVSDPNLPGGQPGSGIPTDGVTVTLRSAAGTVLGKGEQVVTISGGTWSLDYDFADAEASGCYSVEAVAVDNVARIPGLDLSQVAIHTATESKQITVDADPPAVQIDWSAIASGQLTTRDLRGLVNARPVPVEVDWTTNTDGPLASVVISCQHGNAGSWYDAYDAVAGSFAASQSYVWSEEKTIHQAATCKVTMPANGATGISSGVVKVCGVQIASWTTEREVPFIAISPGCGSADACGTGLGFSPVSGVGLAYTPRLPGSAFLNETPLSGEVLHLPFEDSPASTGVLTPLDVSGNGRNGSCTACPLAGQEGPSGRAFYFDGVNDFVSVPDSDAIDFALAQDFSVMAWIKPDATQPTATNIDSDVIEKWSESGGYPYVIRYINEGGGANAGKVNVARYNGSTSASLNSSKLVNDGRYHHVAFVKSGATLTLYVDGAADGSASDLTSGTTTNSSALFIGRRGSGINYFAGMIDDVRIFNRGLSAAEVKQVYSGSGPVLVLPFEQASAASGASIADASGWGHNGTLSTGASDSTDKASTGQVGEYALALDGTDDYVRVEPDAGLDLSGGQFTEAAWINPASTDGSYHGIVGYQGAGGLIQRYPSMWVYQQTSIHAGFGDGTNWNNFTKASVLQSGWNHVATTFDGTTYKLYVNGALAYTTTSFSGRKPYAGTQQVNAGMVGNYYFQGSIDDVRVYPRALADTEIGDLYRAGWQAATLGPSPDNGESTSWTSSVPAGLEGSYQIEMRGTDQAGRSGSVRERSALWNGEVDTLGPRVTFTKQAVNSTTNRYTTTAVDYNLVQTGFTSPCGAGVITSSTSYKSPWYLAASGTANKLYRLVADCQAAVGAATESAKACDSFGNCTTVNAPGDARPAATIQLAAGEATATADPQAADPQAAHPPSAGLQSQGQDVQPTGAQGKVKPPDKPTPSHLTVLFATKVVTSSYYLEPRTINLTGYVLQRGNPHDKPALGSVEVSIGGVTGKAILSEPASNHPYTVTWQFPWTLPAGDLPDGVVYKAVVTARDRSGSSAAQSAANLVVDVIPPKPVTLTLTSSGATVAPGDTIRTAAPELVLTWTPSADRSGLAPYRVTWTARSAVTSTVTTSVQGPTGALEARYVAGEAEMITLEVESRDRNGNATRQSFGPIVADSPLTPDFIEFPHGSMDGMYSAWMDSGCTLIGVDRRLALQALRGTNSRPVQRGYGTWDSRAIRLAWTGADWSTDGDLFLYLDTGPGGTATTFVPKPAVSGGEAVTLASSNADTLIWIQDATTASLLRWDGTTWVTSTLLSDAQYRFDPSLRGGQTDLYLPFDLVGLTPGYTPSGQAFAAEDPGLEGGLRLWATLPGYNAVNSDLVNRLRVFAPQAATLAIDHVRRLRTLADGACPNGLNTGGPVGETGDSELHVEISGDPPGLAFSRLNVGLFWTVTPEETALALPRLAQLAHPALPDGQEITYQVKYENTGQNIASGVRLVLRAFGQLRLLDDSVSLGDIPAGGQGIVTFHGIVDRSLSDANVAVVAAKVYDAAHGEDGPPVEWMLAGNRVDPGAPEASDMGIDWPPSPQSLPVEAGSLAAASMAPDSKVSLIGPNKVVLRGHAMDISGVTSVKIQAVSPSSTSYTDCPLSKPKNGRWTCVWDPTASNGGIPPADGEEFTLSMQATDSFGQTSDWVNAGTVKVDATGPAVDLDPKASGIVPGYALRKGRVSLFGTSHDASGLASVQVCVDEECGNADLVGTNNWSYRLPQLAPLDYKERTITIRAADKHGNKTPEPVVQTVLVDDVAPALTVTQLVGQMLLGGTEKALSGTVTDGGPEAAVTILVRAPDGVETRVAAARDAADWYFDLAGQIAGVYSLSVDAVDGAGNRSTAGPFVVEVVCTDAAPVISALISEPVAGSPMSVTLNSSLLNTGTESLPAGIPVDFTEGQSLVGRVTTTAALAPGEEQTLSLTWSPDGSRDHPVVVTPLEPGPEFPSPFKLCRTPASSQFIVAVRDLPLAAGWNLVSSQANPSNTGLEIVGRGIRGTTGAMVGYADGALQFHPELAGTAPLTSLDGLHGYWVKAQWPDSVMPEQIEENEPAGSWRWSGERLPEALPLSLNAGWNLASYLPGASLPVTAALQQIDTRYTSVLGFNGTALSFYPDVDAAYNTLPRMQPGMGYWIRATAPMTLSYPNLGGTVPVTDTTTVTDTLAFDARLQGIRAAEKAAAVQPSYIWMNAYGRVFMADGTPAPAGAVVTALADGMACGATPVIAAGRYGLLACYGDDATTEAVDGARQGALLTFLLDGQPVAAHPISFNGQPAGPEETVTWAGHGDRWELDLGAPPAPDTPITQ